MTRRFFPVFAIGEVVTIAPNPFSFDLNNQQVILYEIL